MSVTFLSTKTIKLPTGGANSAPSYNNPLLSAHALSKRRPSCKDDSLFLFFTDYHKLNKGLNPIKELINCGLKGIYH